MMIRGRFKKKKGKNHSTNDKPDTAIRWSEKTGKVDGKCNIAITVRHGTQNRRGRKRDRERKRRAKKTHANHARNKLIAQKINDKILPQ